MLTLRTIRIGAHERGLVMRDGALVEILEPGRHWRFALSGRLRIDRVSVRVPLLTHPDIDVIVKSGLLEDMAEILDLGDTERALVWIDGRLSAIFGHGVRVLWTLFHEIRVEVLDARSLRLERPDLATVLRVPGAEEHLMQVDIDAEQNGLLYRDGRLEARLEPGTYALWRNVGRIRVETIDLREQVLDIAGQELMTADKVTLRVNTVVTFRVADAAKTVEVSEDMRQLLYREAQLALRATVGGRELDTLLSEKDAVASELEQEMTRRAARLGVEVVRLGIRDVVLPGEMKDLLNRVTEARKAAEANLIARREETAAMRSQANTARLMGQNPVLMKLRELEVLEKVAERADLKVVLGETGLSDRLTTLV